MIDLFLAVAPASEGLTSLVSFEALLALVTLTLLEIVLGFDNIAFISILADKLPEHQQPKARQYGLLGAMVMRVLLLLAIGWVMGLTKPLTPELPVPWTETGKLAFSGRDIILALGGLFLIWKSTRHIHDEIEGGHHEHEVKNNHPSFVSVVVQIMLLDIVFSLDSVITAVGMVKTHPDHKWIGLTVMIAAVMIAIGAMLLFAGAIGGFIKRHPTMKMLALSFLLLIGVMLVVESVHSHIPKGYIYFAMAFAIGVEVFNMKVRKDKGTPTVLNKH